MKVPVPSLSGFSLTAALRAAGVAVLRYIGQVLLTIVMSVVNLFLGLCHRVARMIHGLGMGLFRFAIGLVRFSFSFARGLVRALFAMDRVDAETVTRARLKLIVVAFSLVFLAIAGRSLTARPHVRSHRRARRRLGGGGLGPPRHHRPERRRRWPST